MNTVRQSALKAEWGRKIHCHTDLEQTPKTDSNVAVTSNLSLVVLLKSLLITFQEEKKKREKKDCFVMCQLSMQKNSLTRLTLPTLHTDEKNLNCYLNYFLSNICFSNLGSFHKNQRIKIKTVKKC